MPVYLQRFILKTEHVFLTLSIYNMFCGQSNWGQIPTFTCYLYSVHSYENMRYVSTLLDVTTTSGYTIFTKTLTLECTVFKLSCSVTNEIRGQLSNLEYNS